MKPTNALGLNREGFKTEYVGERVVQQVWEAKGLTMFGEPGNNCAPRTITTAGANLKRAVTGSRENSAPFSRCLSA